MTNWPDPGGRTGESRRNSTALDTACRVRDGSRRLVAALIAVLMAGGGLVALLNRLDESPAEIHGKVRHATLLESR